ncbi:hypothetical protein HY572_02720 [Candidatus Micrarchaeota archaeon]|nr:hypothetical protein [Candidatus Micrarchaeota archaeon]
MEYSLFSTAFFKTQFDSLPIDERRKIRDRLLLAKANPFRNKAIHSNRFKRLFRIRLDVQGVSIRLVYAVLGSKIVVAGFIPRDNDYRDLDSLLSKMQRELETQTEAGFSLEPPDSKHEKA